MCEQMVEVEVRTGSVDAAVDVRGKARLGMVSDGDRDGDGDGDKDEDGDGDGDRDGGQRGIQEADLARPIKCPSRAPLDRPAAKSIKNPLGMPSWLSGPYRDGTCDHSLSSPWPHLDTPAQESLPLMRNMAPGSAVCEQEGGLGAQGTNQHRGAKVGSKPPCSGPVPTAHQAPGTAVREGSGQGSKL